MVARVTSANFAFVSQRQCINQYLHQPFAIANQKKSEVQHQAEADKKVQCVLPQRQRISGQKAAGAHQPAEQALFELFQINADAFQQCIGAGECAAQLFHLRGQIYFSTLHLLVEADTFVDK
jgi:hypothetical protein